MKIRERGTELAIVHDLSILAAIVSRPVDLSAGMKERRLLISSSEQRSSGGQGKGGGEGGRSDRGGEYVLKQVEKK